MIEPEQVDAVRFGQLLDAAATVPDTTVERARLGEALALWRGSPFEGTRSAWLESVEAPGLVERHLTAVERRTELELAQGRHEELIPQLSRLITQHPTQERLCGLLMRALFRAGRRSDALNAYQRLRQVLDDELGLEPEPWLRELHRRILTADSALAEPVDTRLADGPVPRQLPPGVADFAGRSEALGRLDALLPDAGTPEPTAVVISAVIGTAGVGKTALALHWAHRVADRFPDGQLYVNLRGFDHSGRFMDAGEAVRGFLHALGVPPQRIPPGLEAQAAMYRTLVAGKRILILLDNARDAEQVRPLLPGASGSVVVVTSRSQLAGLVAAKAALPVTIDLLTYSEARQLLSTRLGAGRVAAEPEAVDDIIQPLRAAAARPGHRRRARRHLPGVSARRARRGAARARRPARRPGERAGGLLLVVPNALASGGPPVSAPRAASRPGHLRRGGGQPRGPAPAAHPWASSPS